MTLAQLDAASTDEAFAAFARCCGSRRWAEGMTAARPFANADAMTVTGDVIWAALDRADWLEAFAAHPRIGDARASGDAATEQAGAADGDADVKRRLAERNRDYENRFGYIFIVCATGRSASQMLAMLECRLSNDPGRELSIAAAEQRQITRLRLAKLLDR
ncbi:MAG TPA: 2-oxo-4-hydroxy-4-carboxy-5-ureidoimidazoline decarboxylase [Vicinamibacterales bacterium]|nr:2-oxo-4-hydroxy-4-carboxy-5-ureidoimidazoline decarboxylase [Vicinamibacterales bacterium]